MSVLTLEQQYIKKILTERLDAISEGSVYTKDEQKEREVIIASLEGINKSAYQKWFKRILSLL